MKKFLVIISMFMGLLMYSQNTVLVPKSYVTFNGDNPYDLNSLAKAYFTKLGYEVYMEGDSLPYNLANNRCEMLYVNLVNERVTLKTKIRIQLVDCQGNVIGSSELGESKIKDLKSAFREAFRNAALSFKKTGQTSAFEGNLESSNISGVDVVSSNQKDISNSALYAISTDFGYKIVNDVPEVVMEWYTTSMKDVYLVVKGQKQGIVSQATSGRWEVRWASADNQENTLFFDVKF